MSRGALVAALVVVVLVGALVLVVRPDAPPAEPAAEAPRHRDRPNPRAPITNPTDLPKDQLEFRHAVGDRPAPPTGAPNVVVVLGCTLRRDQLTPYGGPEETTPWLAGAANEGVVFDDVIASSSWTKESSTAIFTGHQALSVGMVEPEVHHSVRVLSDRVDILAERLAARGWYTLGVTANPHLNTDFGLAQGFDHYRDTLSAGFARRNKIHGDEVVRTALEMLDERGPHADRPFYLRLVLIDPHVPMSIPAAERARFEAPGVSDRLATYRSGVRRVDDALSDLDEGLRDRGYGPDDTLFVLITDHGEGLRMPPHHRDQHGRVLYPSVTRVPWVLRGPGVARGARVEGLASHLDVLPTLLGLLGDPDPSLPGRDWSGLVRQGGRTDRTRAFSDTWYFGADRTAVFTPERACQRDWGSTAIRDDTFVEGCFDRRADPDFTSPFTDRALDAELARWRRARRAEYHAWPDIRDVRRGDDVGRQLEALGYTE